MMKEGKNVMAMEAMQGAPKPKETARRNERKPETRDEAEATNEQEGEGRPEREKTPEETLAERYQSLVEQARVYKRRSSELCGVDRVLTYGIDVLMQKYGVEKVVDALESAATADALYEIGGQLGVVINTLEPSAEARNSLYQELRASGDALVEKGKDEDLTLTGDAHPSLPKGHLGRTRQVTFDSLQRLNDLKGSLAFLPKQLSDRAIRMFRSDVSYFSIKNYLATEFQQRYGGDWDAMKTRFQGAEGDMFGLYDKLEAEVDELGDRFGGDKERLMQDIRNEIARKEGEARQVFEQKLVVHMADLNSIRETTIKTEAAQQLMESAIAAMEKTVADMKEKVEQDVGKSTETLRNMLAEVERTPSY
jgi:hypothetical protein